MYEGVCVRVYVCVTENRNSTCFGHFQRPYTLHVSNTGFGVNWHQAYSTKLFVMFLLVTEIFVNIIISSCPSLPHDPVHAWFCAACPDLLLSRLQRSGFLQSFLLGRRTQWGTASSSTFLDRVARKVREGRAQEGRRDVQETASRAKLDAKVEELLIEDLSIRAQDRRIGLENRALGRRIQRLEGAAARNRDQGLSDSRMGI